MYGYGSGCIPTICNGVLADKVLVAGLLYSKSSSFLVGCNCLLNLVAVYQNYYDYSGDNKKLP